MPFFLVNTDGVQVARHHRFKDAKLQQTREYLAGNEFSIEEVRCESGCSFPQCYHPCWHCDGRNKSCDLPSLSVV